MLQIKVTGGLGNQMFQYAYIKASSLRNEVDFSLDISEFRTYFRPFELEFFNIEKKYSNKTLPFYEKLYSKNRYIDHICKKIQVICKGINPHHFVEKQFHFNSSFSEIKKGYIEGYFQTERYFKDFESEIRNDLSFINPISEKNAECVKGIKGTESVSVHIRRGDYVTNKKANSFHGTCDVEYYKNALNYIKKELQNPCFYFFSDDIQWVKDNISVENSKYIDWNTGEKSFEDMRLMSMCKHNIIANSSFSWWGAWLNSNENKIVISPKKWFNTNTINTQDIIPETWIKI